MRRMISNPQSSSPREQVRSREGVVKIPHDAVNEQILLAAAVLDKPTRQRLVERLPPDAFLVREHVEAWIMFQEMVRNKLDFDPGTVQQLSGGKVDAGYLVGLAADRIEVPSNLDYHIGMLEWDRVRVEAVKGPVSALLEALKDPITPPERVHALAQQLASSFERGTSASLLRDPVALVKSSMAGMQQRRVRACYPFGIAGLDMQDDNERWRMVPGAAPGKTTVITGVPGAGKSTVAVRIALAQANAGRRVLYGAWEMGAENTLELMAAMNLEWSRYVLATGMITADQQAELSTEMERLSQFVRFMRPPALEAFKRNKGGGGAFKMTNERAIDTIHAVISDMGADVFIADLWKRCLVRTEPDEEEQALIHQQNVADETKCHVIILQQQRSKDVEQRIDKRPTREAIKGSSAYVEIADTILGVHRPALWKACDDVVLEVDVLKQRWGAWPIAVEFDWDSDKGSIAGGRTIPYDQPASMQESAAGDFLSAQTGSGKRRKKSNGGAAT